MKKKDDIRVLKTKKKLYDGLLFLMKDNAFEDIKVSDICIASKINRSTFYDHFSDKYELLSSLIKDLEIELASSLDDNNCYKSEKEYYMKMIELLFDHISNNITTYTAIVKNNNNTIAGDIFRNTLIADVKKHINKNSNTNYIPIDIVTIFYVSAVVNVCIYYISSNNNYSKDDILSYINKLLPDSFY